MQQDTYPVVGHHAGWGLTTPRTRIEPYKLSPGSIDTMCVRVREKIDIHGVGTDVVLMEGTFTVRRDHPCGVGNPPVAKWGESCVKTEFRSLELGGESSLFGTVRVHLDPEYSSHGEVAPSEEGSLAASCVAHCYPVIELPELGLRLTTNGQPISLASKVVQIPPVGDVARSENSALLVDELGSTVGEIVSSDIEVGELVCSFPLGNTRPRSAGPEEGHEHTRHSHPDPSGPGFYAEPPEGQPTASASSASEHSHSHEHMDEQPHTPTPQPTPHSPGRAQPDITSSLMRLEQELRTLVELVREMARQ